MSVKTYPNTDRTQITPHFNAQEFKCKCGQHHDILISDELLDKLEQLRDALKCSKIIITSGYRCPTHDRNVGGSGSGQHTEGKAADFVCYDQSGQVISSKLVCCKAQDLGFKGIANITNDYDCTHADVRTSGKWYGNEVYGTSTVTDDFYSYFGIQKNQVIAKGIDVSYAQGKIDWDKIKASGQVDFALLRAGYGKEISQIDSTFERNYSECKRLRIPVGIYWYSYAVTEEEALQEAAVCLKAIAGKQLQYPLYIDIEESEQLNEKTLNTVADTFCKAVVSAGYTAGLYCSSYFVNEYLRNDFPYELWIADYSKNNRCKYPCGIWQYGVAGHPDYDTFNTGSVSGVSGQCDLDYCYKSYDTSTVPEDMTGKESILEKILKHIKSIDEKIMRN